MLGDQALTVAREVRTGQTSGSPAYPILVHGVLDLVGEQPSGFLAAAGVVEAGENALDSELAQCPNEEITVELAR